MYKKGVLANGVLHLVGETEGREMLRVHYNYLRIEEAEKIGLNISKCLMTGKVGASNSRLDETLY